MLSCQLNRVNERDLGKRWPGLAKVLIDGPTGQLEGDGANLSAEQSRVRVTRGSSTIMEMRNILTVAYFFLAIYVFRGGVMKNLVVCQSWKFVSAGDLPAVHKSVFSRLPAHFVSLFCLLVLVNILLTWFHDPAISASSAVVAAALNLFILVLTSSVFLPMDKQLEMQLDKAKSTELIDRMSTYDQNVRTIPSGCITVAGTIMMMYEVAGASRR